MATPPAGIMEPWTWEDKPGYRYGGAVKLLANDLDARIWQGDEPDAEVIKPVLMKIV